MDNYDRLVEKISQHAGVPKEDIERKVEAKRAKLSGLVSKEGAAQIVAAELGINFENEHMKLSEIVEGMKKANSIVQVIDVYPVRAYSKNGREGKVANLLVGDETGNVRMVLWDVNHIGLVEKGEIEKGDVLDVTNASVRNGELHLSSFSDIKKSNQKINGVISSKQYSMKKLKDAKPGERVIIRGVIVQSFEPRYFEVCPECGKKVSEGACKVHGAVSGVKRALLNIVIDDGTESVRAVLFGDQILQLGFSEEEIMNLELFNSKKDSILGEERVFSGTIRTNQLYNTQEFAIEKAEIVDIDSLLKQLQGA